MVTEDEIKRGRYLGDGVYASHDGYQVWLAVGDHQNKVVALEPPVMDALILYHLGVQAYYRAKAEKEANNGDL